MADRTVISLQEITRRFGALTAVDRVSLDLEEGEFFALLGPSGCGKTTLLRMIAGFEDPDDGAMLLDGEDMTRLGANRRPVNLMFQSYALFPHMSVRNNVSYGLEMEKLARPEIARRVGDILDMTQLSALADRKPDQLSGGQRQRVALAPCTGKTPPASFSWMSRWARSTNNCAATCNWNSSGSSMSLASPSSSSPTIRKRRSSWPIASR